MMNNRIPKIITKIFLKNLRLNEIRLFINLNINQEIANDNPIKKIVEMAIEAYAPNGL